MQSTVANLGGHLADSELELEPSKCQLIIFNQNKMPRINQSNISINGDTVKSSRKIKFLRVTIQDNLSWGAHVNKVAQACQNGIKIINGLRRTWWGADPKVLMSIHKALIRSRIEYAGFILNTKEKKLTAKLDRIQFRAIRAALRFRNSTPGNVLLVEAREPTIKQRKKMFCNKYVSKILTTPNHPLVNLLREMCERLEYPLVALNIGIKPLLIEAFEEIERMTHLIASFEVPTFCST